MKVPKMMLKVQVVMLFFAVALYGQEAFAVAISEITSNIDWSSLVITKDGSTITPTYSSKGFYYNNSYTTPNNPKAETPEYNTGNWNAWDHETANPAGASGHSYATGGANVGNIYADSYAKADHVSFGDTAGDAYSGGSESSRYGTFAAVAGLYTFSVNYSITQTLYANSFGYTGGDVFYNDKADANTTVNLLVGQNTYEFINAVKPKQGDMVITGSNSINYYNTTWDDFDGAVYNVATGLWEKTFTTTGTLTLTQSLTAGTYFFAGEIYSDSYAMDAEPGMPQNPSAPVPEPCTLVLMGLGAAGLGFARRRGILSSISAS